MKIAFASIYGDLYSKDKLFDIDTCKIGENLLMPEILLKKALFDEGNIVHTIDVAENYDVVLFRDVPPDSWLTINNFIDRIKYIVKMKWRKDYLLKAVYRVPKCKLFLQINEPPTVAPQSYDKKNHEYFFKVLTWNDDLVDNKKYYKFAIPEYWNHKINVKPYSSKREFVIIASNKKSTHPNELYSKRRDIINYFENESSNTFDLYGFGWESEGLRNWKGTVEKKIDVLSQYKFCFCYENVEGINGYITEKIFDCFFSGCVPVYLGANNVLEYIPSNSFIDVRKFENFRALISFLENMQENEYSSYICNAKNFLESKKYKEVFSPEVYIKKIKEIIDVEKL